MRAAQRYVQSECQTATPERLMVLLFQTALGHMRRGAAALEAGDAPAANVALSKACEIVVELEASLDASKAPELCQQLAGIYQFVCMRLTSANAFRNAGQAREAEKVFAPIADAFAQAVEKVAAGQQRTP